MTMSMDDLTVSRIEVTQAIASAILKAIGDTALAHDNDPMGAAVIAGGFLMALDMAGDVDPEMFNIVRRVLLTEKEK